MATDDVVTYLCQQKGLVQERTIGVTMALIARAAPAATAARDVTDDLRHARRTRSTAGRNACLRAYAAATPSTS